GMRQGNVRTAYDVIIFPHQGGTAKRLVFDIGNRGQALAYRKSDTFKYLGMYGESDDITGGMGLTGVAELDRFVKDGGMLVTLGAASYVPAEFGLAPRIDATRPSSESYAPGALIEAEILCSGRPLFYACAPRVGPGR